MSDILKQPITDRSAWRGAQLRNDTSWYWSLPPDAIRDIDAALEKLAATPVPLSEMTRADMPLPSIENELAALVREFEHGRGFIVIRGLPLERYTDDQVDPNFAKCPGRSAGPRERRGRLDLWRQKRARLSNHGGTEFSQ